MTEMCGMQESPNFEWKFLDKYHQIIAKFNEIIQKISGFEGFKIFREKVRDRYYLLCKSGRSSVIIGYLNRVYRDLIRAKRTFKRYLN
jgi:hypothetical protein